MAALGISLMVAGLFLQLHLAGGVLILGQAVTVSLLPLYLIPFGIFQRLTLLASGVANAIFPIVAEVAAVGDRTKLELIQTRGTRLLLLGALPIVVSGLLLAGPFLTHWLGPDFAVGGTVVLQSFLIAFGLGTMSVPGTEVARGGGHPARVIAYTAVLALVNIGGAAFLTPQFGVAGAAAAMPLAQGAGAAYILAASGQGMLILGALRRPAVIGIAYAIAIAAVSGAIQGLLARALAGGALALVYVAGAYHFGLDARDRSAIRRLLPS
jgi:O-antigen/teichoic acid export membrane protein